MVPRSLPLDHGMSMRQEREKIGKWKWCGCRGLGDLGLDRKKAAELAELAGLAELPRVGGVGPAGRAGLAGRRFGVFAGSGTIRPRLQGIGNRLHRQTRVVRLKELLRIFHCEPLLAEKAPIVSPFRDIGTEVLDFQSNLHGVLVSNHLAMGRPSVEVHEVRRDFGVVGFLALEHPAVEMLLGKNSGPESNRRTLHDHHRVKHR